MAFHKSNIYFLFHHWWPHDIFFAHWTALLLKRALQTKKQNKKARFLRAWSVWKCWHGCRCLMKEGSLRKTAMTMSGLSFWNCNSVLQKKNSFQTSLSLFNHEVHAEMFCVECIFYSSWVIGFSWKSSEAGEPPPIMAGSEWASVTPIAVCRTGTRID